jgi:hypothetical protein
VNDGDADELFLGLLALLRISEAEEIVRRMLDEVERTITQGRSTSESVPLIESGQQKRKQQVRRVVAWSSKERLQLLVDAIEAQLITPIDVLESTLVALEGHGDFGSGLSLRFEEDPAGLGAGRGSLETIRNVARADPVVVDRQAVDEAQSSVRPLRLALAAIRSELET